MQRKRKSRKSGYISLLSLLRRELREAKLRNFGGSSYVVSSVNATNAAPNPLLSSFILSDVGINAFKSLIETMGFKKDTSKTSLKRRRKVVAKTLFARLSISLESNHFFGV
ncbi:hypothetical protein R6Q57_020898 [Mikania cordata]